MAGIRTAAVWTIGAATLSTTVGQPSLGDLIFAGLQTQNWALVLAGCVAAAALALAVDALLGVDRARHPRRGAGGRSAWGRGMLVVGLLVALTPMWPARDGDARTVTIGAKNFSEQYILARVIGHRLEDGRLPGSLSRGAGLGGGLRRARERGYRRLCRLFGHALDQRDAADATRRRARRSSPGSPIGRRRTSGVRLLGALGFENAYAFAMRGDDAAAKARHRQPRRSCRVPRLRSTSATDLEFLDRPEWAAVRDAYGLRFAATAAAITPTFMYRALASGRADVISAFSSDGRIAADHLTVLADPKGAIPGYDAILLLAPRACERPAHGRCAEAADRRDPGRSDARGQLPGRS